MLASQVLLLDAAKRDFERPNGSVKIEVVRNSDKFGLVRHGTRYEGATRTEWFYSLYKYDYFSDEAALPYWKSVTVFYYSKSKAEEMYLKAVRNGYFRE